jgi:hypothetical protein
MERLDHPSFIGLVLVYERPNFKRVLGANLNGLWKDKSGDLYWAPKGNR